MTFSFILRLALKRLVSLPWGDFLRIVEQVPTIARDYPIREGATKQEALAIKMHRAAVLGEWIVDRFPNLIGVRCVLEIAVRYFKVREK